MVEVAIAIATFRRPRGLERLLSALQALETTARVSVFVADNDASRHEGFNFCQKLCVFYRWPLDAFIVPERGIAQARNALTDRVLEKSSAQFVAMLDDDEWPNPKWLDAFLRAQQAMAADALHGDVHCVFEVAPARWATDCKGLASLYGKTGPIRMIESSSNILVSRACLEGLPKPHFDPGFALTGGEDKDFFTRLRVQGKRFAWANEAVVYAHVPASRIRLRWVLARAYRVGNSDLRVFLKYPHGAFAFVREIAKIAGALLLFPLMMVILAAIPNRRAQPLCKLFRAAGKTAALFGRHYNEYAVTHVE